ncbi:VOC family protein [Actinacidiphila bryophytorum]|uniref:VOC family protein n=1 Tax=Actinacidiphila bryophytorum TaxID=1436133 RepID=UPI002176B8ED|nr:VOC family protein [Actinacidiphila bryophytorum]UWE13794.1 VOC family protein [Actinacidiphila bryophytorum]
MPANPPKNSSSPFASFRGHHVGLRVKDFEAAKDWYIEKLDFRVLHSWEGMNMFWAYLSPAADDDFHIEIMGGPGVEREAPVLDSVHESLAGTGILHFCLEVENVEAALAELTNRGVAVVLPVIENPDINRKLAFVRDPWGNMIELSERTSGGLA